MKEGHLSPKGEIVVYQPDGTMRLEVRIEDRTVWLTQAQMVELFGRDQSVIARHIRNVFQEGEVPEESNMHFLHIPFSDRPVRFYSLNVVISVGYRVKSLQGTRFRIWATDVLLRYLTNGQAFNDRICGLECRMAKTEKALEMLVQSALPMPEQVFVNGQFLDAHVELLRIVRTAKRRLVLVDNYIDERVFTLFSQRGDDVECTIYSRGAGRRDVQLVADRYAQQYPGLPIELVYTAKSHDRFLIVDDTTWHVGASPKDAGARIFALMKMELDPSVILALLP